MHIWAYGEPFVQRVDPNPTHSWCSHGSSATMVREGARGCARGGEWPRLMTHAPTDETDDKWTSRPADDPWPWRVQVGRGEAVAGPHYHGFHFPLWRRLCPRRSWQRHGVVGGRAARMAVAGGQGRGIPLPSRRPS